MRATEFGNYADAIFKAHVPQAIDDGVLPRTLHVTSRYKFGADVIDTTTGLARDLTTATGRQVVSHDTGYIGRTADTAVGPVFVTDVLPLVYWR